MRRMHTALRASAGFPCFSDCSRRTTSLRIRVCMTSRTYSVLRHTTTHHTAHELHAGHILSLTFIPIGTVCIIAQIAYYVNRFHLYSAICIKNNGVVRTCFRKKSLEQLVQGIPLLFPAQQILLQTVKQKRHADDHNADDKQSGDRSGVVAEIGVILDIIAHAVARTDHLRRSQQNK